MRTIHSDELVVLFNHRFPRISPNDPNKNKGWEIWKKVK